MSNKKLILFVDDKPKTHAFFRDYLISQDSKWIIEMAFGIEEAIDFITDNKDDIFCVVLDLFFPDTDLESLFTKIVISPEKRVLMNEGQVLGVYIHSLGIPYFYMTAHRGSYQDNWEEDQPIACLGKEVDIKDFEKVLMKKTSTYKLQT